MIQKQRYYIINRLELSKIAVWDWEEYFDERELLLNPYRYYDDE